MVEVLSKPLTRDEAIRRLRALEPQIRALGVVSLHLFGSTARDEAQADSDVDLFGDLEPGRVFGLDYFGLPREIGELLGRRVDFMGRDSLHPLLKDRIVASSVQVF